MRPDRSLAASSDRRGAWAPGLVALVIAGCRTQAVDVQQFHRRVGGQGSGACAGATPPPAWRCPGCSLRFSEPVALEIQAGAASHWLIDLDGDGHTDVVRASGQTLPAPPLLEVRWGRGGADFDDSVVLTAEGSCFAGNSQEDFVAGDFDEGGGEELLLACGRTLLAVSAAPGRTLSQRRMEPGDWYWRDLRAADMNGDCHLDLCGIGQLPPSPGYPRGHAVPVCLLGDGRGGLSTPRYPLEGGTDPGDLAIGDFDGSGSLDVAVSQTDDNDRPAPAVLLFNDGDGELGDPLTLGFDTPPLLRAADVDGDGRVDLLAAGNMHIGRTNDVYGYSLINRGGGQLTQGPRFDGLCNELGPVADIDGDGALDLGCRRRDGSPLLLGTGDGHFTPSPLLGDPPRQERMLLVGDLDRDGRPDAVDLAVASGKSTLTVLLNRTE